MARDARAAPRTATARGHYAGLTRREIIDAALELLAEGGGARLTMRSLAARMRVSPASIYWHVGSRAELVEAVLAHVGDERRAVELVGETTVDRVAELAVHAWREVSSAPEIARIAAQSGQWEVLAGPLVGRIAEEMAGAGLDDHECAGAVFAIRNCIAGFLLRTMETPSLLGPSPPLDAVQDLLQRTVRAVVVDYITANVPPSSRPA